MHTAAEHYIENHEDFDDLVPSLVGMAIALNVCEQTLTNWADADERFLGTYRRCVAMQHKKLLSGGLSGQYNAAITKLMLHNHGHSERTEQTLQGPGGGPVEMDMKWEVEVIESGGD